MVACSSSPTWTFAHSIDFWEWNVETHEELQCFLSYWCTGHDAGVASIQTQSLAHFPKDKSLRQIPTKRDITPKPFKEIITGYLGKCHMCNCAIQIIIMIKINMSILIVIWGCTRVSLLEFWTVCVNWEVSGSNPHQDDRKLCWDFCSMCIP